MTKDIQRIAENIVRSDVHYCVSSLIHTMAMSCHACDTTDDVGELCELAANLFAPLQDWESAARDAGWIENNDDAGNGYIDTNDGQKWACSDWEELCHEFDIDPYETEILEHWIVSEFLAKELEARGERVEFDFQGLIVWGRTVSGQAISMDAIIQDIAKDISKVGEKG